MEENIFFEISEYKENETKKGSAMPFIKKRSKLKPYKRRFEYLLLNTPEIHQRDQFSERSKLFALYPNTSLMKREYMNKLINDKKLIGYFDEALSGVRGNNSAHTYSVSELTEVASKFFYCDKVNADTSVQSHVCISFNGIGEARWEKDYTLLSAFCFEAIFNDLEKTNSLLRATYSSEKQISCKKFRNNIRSLDQYLDDVRLDFFERMKNNEVLKKELLSYYELNKGNLPFSITLQ